VSFILCPDLKGSHGTPSATSKLYSYTSSTYYRLVCIGFALYYVKIYFCLVAKYWKLIMSFILTSSVMWINLVCVDRAFLSKGFEGSNFNLSLLELNIKSEFISVATTLLQLSFMLGPLISITYSVLKDFQSVLQESFFTFLIVAFSWAFLIILEFLMTTSFVTGNQTLGSIPLTILCVCLN